VAAFADGVIVGSALIRCVLDAPDAATGEARLRALSAELAEGVRAPKPL
jgi:tryptophan synthase alpha chain